MSGRNPGALYIVSIIFLALGFAFIHMYHVSTLFENDRHFSHLSNLEREMTFRTEMGFYYHYYKIMVNAATFEEGLQHLLHDNRTEYPEVINAVKRFNLYPEIVIGALFRIFDTVTKQFDLPTKECWEVSRGPSLSPVNSCEGLGDPIYFYLEFVWYCAGLSIAILFLYAVFISDSLTGGLVTVISFLYNHGHCTRVQWTPPLRESFAYPFCLLQMLLVSYYLKRKFYVKSFSDRQIVVQVCYIATSTAVSLVLWQFSQFVIASQATSIFLMYCVGLLDRNSLLIIVFSQLVGLLQAAVVLFGNELLFQSILFSLLVAILFITVGCENKLPFLSVRGLLVLGAAAGITLTLKLEMNQFMERHDAHIFDILRSKLTNFKNFHTLLYTCSPEFDFLPFSTIRDVTKTGLIPVVALVIISLSFRWGREMFERRSKPFNVEKSFEPEVIYNILQLGAFTVMAIFVMRLKLFWTPHLCLTASLLMSSRYLPMKKTSKYAALAAVIAAMSYQGIKNLDKQMSIIGEYANLPFEQVLNWINAETQTSDVFAGPMPIMANVLLSTGRNIVNHPHYEHYGIRDRTLKVYSIFSRQSPEEVYARLVEMGVDYVILDESWCFPRGRENCSMVDLWDITDVKNKGREPLCPKLFAGNSSPFVRAFSNNVFVILSLKTRQFIEISPSQRFQKI